MKRQQRQLALVGERVDVHVFAGGDDSLANLRPSCAASNRGRR